MEKRKNINSIFEIIQKIPGYSNDIFFKTKSKSKRDKNHYIPTHTVQESNVFQNAENYEIELEYDDDLMRKIHPDMPMPV